MKYNTNKEIIKLQGGKSIPGKYGNVSEIAQYNLENGTHFYTIDQIEQYKKKSNPGFLSKLAQTIVKVPVTPGVSTSVATSLQNIPKVESTVGQELGYAAGLLTSPMLLSEIGTYGPLVGGLRLATGSAGAAGGSYVVGKVGDFADKKLGTNWIGDTGRLLGGFAGFGAGMKTTTPLIRSAAGKGLTLHMPQETFTNLRGQYFDRVANNIKFDNSTPWKLYNRDRLVKDYLEFGPDANILGDNVSKLVHWDPMTTGKTSALPINGGFNRDAMHFPHFENGKLVPAVGEIQSKLGNGQMYDHPYHPIFFGGNKPWWEVPKGDLTDTFLRSTTINKSDYSGPRQYFKRWYKNERKNVNSMRKWYEKYGPQNKSDRYLITDPENLKDYEFSHRLGIMGSEVPMSKLEGFEYDPLLGTFKRARYVDPKVDQQYSTIGHLKMNPKRDINTPDYLSDTYFGEPMKPGTESDVFESPFENNVIKIHHGEYVTPQEAIKWSNKRMSDRNKVPFIQKPIKRIGLMIGPTGGYTPVYSQIKLKPLIEKLDLDKIKSIFDQRMIEHGWSKTLEDFSYKKDGQHINFWDLKNDNFGLDENGNLFGFDLDIFKQGGILKWQTKEII